MHCEIPQHLTDFPSHCAPSGYYPGTVKFPNIVSFTMYFRSKFLEISKPIHFWNRDVIRVQKINVGICADTDKAVIMDFQNVCHKIRILRYLGF